MKENKNSLGANKVQGQSRVNKHNKQENQEQRTTSQWVFKTPKRTKIE